MQSIILFSIIIIIVIIILVLVVQGKLHTTTSNKFFAKSDKKYIAIPMNDDELEKYLDKWDLEKFRGEILVFKRSREYDFIGETNKYSFNERMKCRRRGLSPYEYSQKHNVSIEEAKEIVGRCTLYPVPAGLAVLNLFKPQKWLDPTAGWGDRLRSALIAEIPTYVGIDSNSNLANSYKRIIDDYPQARNGNYKVITSRFQDADLGDTKFDLVFTSPPFNNTEIYEEGVVWNDQSHFYDEFLYPLFEFSFKQLVKGGHLVFYIENIDIDKMLTHVKQLLPGLKYEGVFYYEGDGAPRPHYVWLKIQ